MSKHTATPWTVTEYTNYDGFSIYTAGAPGFGCIAERWENNPTPERLAEMHANAAFIVECCNNYAELVKLLRQTVTILDQSNGWAGHGKIFDQARAALANEKEPDSIG
jgi:hypothetical protein